MQYPSLVSFLSQRHRFEPIAHTPCLLYPEIAMLLDDSRQADEIIKQCHEKRRLKQKAKLAWREQYGAHPWWMSAVRENFFLTIEIKQPCPPCLGEAKRRVTIAKISTYWQFSWFWCELPFKCVSQEQRFYLPLYPA
jgi:hypothetical protein